MSLQYLYYLAIFSNTERVKYRHFLGSGLSIWKDRLGAGVGSRGPVHLAEVTPPPNVRAKPDSPSECLALAIQANQSSTTQDLNKQTFFSKD